MKRFPVVALLAFAVAAHAQRIGEVDTVFKLIGPDHKIVVEAHDDPSVKGVTCYVSRAKTGGIKGGLVDAVIRPGAECGHEDSCAPSGAG